MTILTLVKALLLISFTCLVQAKRMAGTDGQQLCMMNCGQCKEMYGEYFDGRRCAEFCLASFKSSLTRELEMPDCNDPESVDQFLKSSSEVYSKPLSQALVSSSRSKYSGTQNHPNNVYKTFGSRNYGGAWKKRIVDEDQQLTESDIKPRWYFL